MGRGTLNNLFVNRNLAIQYGFVHVLRGSSHKRVNVTFEGSCTKICNNLHMKVGVSKF